MKLKMISIDNIFGQIMLLRNLIFGLNFFFETWAFSRFTKISSIASSRNSIFYKNRNTIITCWFTKKKIAGTNAKELVSFQALAALNIHLGGDKDVSKKALTEYFCNLTFQALSKENDNILMSFDSLNDLVYDINERLAKLLSNNWKEHLSKTQYNFELPPKLQIQKDVEMYQNGSKKEPLFPPISCSTSWKTNQIEEIYDEEKENYLKTAITFNKADIDTAVQIAEESNKEVVNNIIDPTPGLIVDDTLIVDDQHKYRSNDLETTFNLSNQIQEKLDNVLTLMKERTNSVNFMIQKPVEEIPNDPLSNEKGDTKTEDFYIDDNYSNLLGRERSFSFHNHQQL